MVEPKKVVWSKLAFNQLEEAYEYICKDSPQSALKVKSNILEKAAGIADAPEKYPLDKYRKDNNGSVRAFEEYRFRVAYQVTESQIRILRLRHTSRLPKKY